MQKARESSAPDERVSAVLDVPGRSPDNKTASFGTQSIMARTISGAKKALGFGKPQRRSENNYRPTGIERLEERLALSGSPVGAEVRYLDAEGEYAPQTETVTETVPTTVNFRGFGVGQHPEHDMTKNIQTGMPSVRFVGDGGIEVLENGSIASLAQGRGRGDWAFLPLQPIDVTNITIRVTGGSGGKIHMKTLTSDEWLDVGSGGTFPVNRKNITEFSASTPDGLRLIFESLTVQLTVPREVRREVGAETEKGSANQSKNGEPKPPDELVTVMRMETVTEKKTIDFSKLEHGTHTEKWTTTIEGIGKVTMWFEGGIIVDAHGISAARQPWAGTGWYMNFENGAVKLFSAELDFRGTNPQGMLRLQNNGDYLREGGRIIDFPLIKTVDFGGRMTNQLSEGQKDGTVALKSLTVEVTVQREVARKIGAVELMKTADSQLNRIDVLTQPWDISGQANRLKLLNDRAALLKTTAKELTVIGGNVSKLLMMVTKEPQVDLQSLSERIQIAALRLAASIGEWQAAEKQVWDEGLKSVSPALQEKLIKNQGIDGLKILRTAVDLALSTETSAKDMQIIRSVELPDEGGTLQIQGIRGRSPNSLTLSSAVQQGKPIITANGRGIAIDLTQEANKVLAVRFTPRSSVGADQVTVLFMRGNQVLNEQIVEAGTEVSYEDSEGITSVLVKNVYEAFSDDVKAFDDYRRTYQSPYLYPWQDPGPAWHFFVSIRKDLAPRQGEITAQAYRGEQSHPLSISGLSITRDLAVIHGAVAPLSSATNREIAKISAPRIDTVQPDVYRMYQLPYSGHVYNGYSVRKYADNPRITGVSYKQPNGHGGSLPPELYSFDGETLVIYPTGQNLRLYVSMEEAGVYRSSSGIQYNFEIICKTGEALADVIPIRGVHITVDDTTLYIPNQGGEPGWRSGATGEEAQHRIPNAVGNVKMAARFSNNGTQGVSFTAFVYSGHEGTPGWNTVQASYKGSLGAGESRTLVTAPIGMNANASGAGMLRIVLVSDDGKILTTAGRTVGAASMSASEQAAHAANVYKDQRDAVAVRRQETLAYFASIGQAVPPQIVAAWELSKAQAAAGVNVPPPAVTLDPALTERELRRAFKARYAAIQSGDPARIELETRAFNVAAGNHDLAIASLGSAQTVVQVPSIPVILAEETVKSDKLKATPAGKVEGMRYAMQGMTRELVEIFESLNEVGGDAVAINAAVEALGTIDRLSRVGILADMLGKFHDPNSGQAISSPYGATFGVRKDSNAAKLFWSFYGSAPSLKDDRTALINLCAAVEFLTGIEARFLYGLAHNRPVAVLGLGLRLYFDRMGYGDLFVDKGALAPAPLSPSSPLVTNLAVKASPNGTYRDFAEGGRQADTVFPLQFDVAVPQNYSLHHAAAYLVYNGVQIFPDQPVAIADVPTLSLAVPLGKVYDQLLKAKAMTGTAFSGSISFRIAAWFTLPVSGSATLQSNGLTMSQTLSVELRGKLKDLSTLPNTNENKKQRNKENIVLTEIGGQKPFAPAQGERWSVTIGSGAHHSGSFYAMDIGLPGRDTDWGKDTLAIAGGTIAPFTDKSMNYGTIKIDHVTQGVRWQSEYLHSILDLKQDANGNVVTKEITDANGKAKTVNVYTVSQLDASFKVLGIRDIWEGMTVKAGDAFSFVGGRGPFDHDGETHKVDGQVILFPNAFAPHIHEENHIEGGDALNIANVVEQEWKIPVVGLDAQGGTAVATWHNNLQTANGGQKGFWANDSLKLIFFRDHTNPANSANNYWVAWEVDKAPEQMERVVYVTKLTDGTIINGWLQKDNYSQLWNPINREFIPR